MSALELENLTLDVKLSGTEEITNFDVVAIEMFLQELIAKSGRNDGTLPAFEIVPHFQRWMSELKNLTVTPSEAWQIMKICRQRFEEAKKKLEGS